MDDLDRFCLRMLGDPEAAGRVAEQVRAEGEAEPPAGGLRHAAGLCRMLPGLTVEAAQPKEGLAGAVAGEVQSATAQLERQAQEVLALRDHLDLSPGQVARILDVDPAAVPVLLAQARIELRARLRGTPVVPGDCPDRARTLRTATLRQDREPVEAAEEDWLFDHLGACGDCARAHAAMLEGAAAYRSWAS